MKADLYVQSRFWASIDIPGDSLLALLAKGMITEANEKAVALAREFTNLGQVQCSISLRLTHSTTYSSDTKPQNHTLPTENTHGNQSPLPSLPPAPTPHS